MSNWAHISDDGLTITNVSVGDAEWGATQNLIDLNGIDPEPGIGWTRTDPTAPWTAPPAPPAPPPTPQEVAAANAAALATHLPAIIAQATADAATFAAFTTADLASADALAIHQRVSSGLVQLVEGVAAIAVATGVIPSPN